MSDETTNDDSRWKGPVDRSYAFLIRSLRRKAEDLVAKADTFLIDSETREVISAPAGSMGCTLKPELVDFVVIPSSKNSAWALARTRDPDGFYLLYGRHTMGRDLAEVANESGGASVEIEYARWDDRLLEPMKWLLAKDKIEDEFCDCGHQLARKRMVHFMSGMTGNIPHCAGCGYLGASPDAWKELQ